MRAAVTDAPRSMQVRDDVAEPGPPGRGEVVVRPCAVGICGSDFHFYAGELHELVGATLPRVQGHEVAAVVEAVGADVGPAGAGPGRGGLEPGATVALWPLTPCGACRPCRMGRGNVCERFTLIGIHTDGGLQERLTMPAGQVFPIAEERPEVAALTEPVSIAVRAVNRGRVAGGEHAVVLGAGSIGQAIAVAALERGAAVLLVDPLERRLETGRRAGADAIPWTDAEEVVARAREWAGDSGPPVVLDATGAPDAIRAAVDMAPSAGRVVIVGMGPHEVALRVGSFTEKELDVLGTSVCTAEEFAAAVALVERNGDRLAPLVTHEFDFDRAPEALTYAMDNPTEVMKVVIRGA
jgi:threonine dehydrogenase-like Zn-dependent dehydrogenase